MPSSGAQRGGSAIGWLTRGPVTREALVIYTPGERPVLLVNFYDHVPNAQRIATEAHVRWAGERAIETAIGELRQCGAAGGRIGMIGTFDHRAHAALAELGEPVDMNADYTRLRLVKSDQELAWVRIGAAMTCAAPPNYSFGTPDPHKPSPSRPPRLTTYLRPVDSRAGSDVGSRRIVPGRPVQDPSSLGAFDMRGLRLLLGVLAGLLLLASTAAAAPLDTVNVTGSTGQGGLPIFGNVQLHATAGSHGQHAHGTMSFYDGDSFAAFTGTVTCMRVLGADAGAGTATSPTSAIIGVRGVERGMPDQNGNPNIVKGIWTFEVTDNGGVLDPIGLANDVLGYSEIPLVGQDCRPLVAPQLMISDTLSVGRAVIFDAPH